MSAALEVIRRFMKSLDDSTVSISYGGSDYWDRFGIEVKKNLDAAVRAASDKFSSLQNVIDSLLTDVRQAASGTDFLKRYCGIDLDNADTGAITGADAGGSVVKTAESVVPENYTDEGKSISYYRQFTVGGLTVVMPETRDTDQIRVEAMLYKYWMPSVLQLIEESYGLSFNEPGTSCRTMTVKFYNGADEPANKTSLAYANYIYDQDGKATKIELSINNDYLADMSRANGNGKSSKTAGYTDRTIAHELTHTLMQVNVTGFAKLPNFIKEGFAELVHGIDDERTRAIKYVADNPGYLAQALATDDYYAPTVDGSTLYATYAGGYILLRYLAKQGAEGTAPPVGELPAGLSYSSDETCVIVDGSFAGAMVWLNENSGVGYKETARDIDASGCARDLVLVGRSDAGSVITTGTGSSAVWGGGATADTFNLLSGRTDHVWFANNDGYDTVNGFGSNDDVFFYSGYTGARAVGDTLSVSGGDAVVTTKGGKLTLSGAGTAGNTVGLMDSNMKLFKALIGGSGAMAFDEGTNIYLGKGTGSVQVADRYTPQTVLTLSLLPGLNDYYFKGVDTIDGTNTTAQLILIGEKGGDELYGGKSKNAFWGGGAGSQYLGGNSAATDFFWFGTNDGADTFGGLSAGDGIFLYDTGDINQVKVSVNGDKTVTVATGAATLTSTEAADELLGSGGLSFILASGAAYRYDTGANKFVRM